MQLIPRIFIIIFYSLGLVGIAHSIINARQQQYAYTDGTAAPNPSGGSLPQGALILKTSGDCPDGTTEATELDNVTLVGTTVANGNAGSTGGNNSITPAGTNEELTFTGSSANTNSVSAGTPSGTNTLGAVDAHAGTAIANHASHTHQYTQVVNHVHVQNAASSASGGLVGSAPDTSTNTAVATGYSTANPTGGVATGTTVGPDAILTHSVTQPNNHVFTQPTFTGNALGNHNHSLTATGTINTPTFSGNQFDNRSAFMRVIVCRVN